MLLFFSTLFLISMAGLAALLLMKRWELKYDHVVFRSVRPRLYVWGETALNFCKDDVVAQAGETVSRSLGKLRVAARAILARWLLGLEHIAERSLHLLRHAQPPQHATGQVSEFLREVTAYKRSLARRRAKQESAAAQSVVSEASLSPKG